MISVYFLFVFVFSCMADISRRSLSFKKDFKKREGMGDQKSLLERLDSGRLRQLFITSHIELTC